MNDGRGILLIWNDMAAGTEQAFRSWHDEEHIPERVAVPGFRFGRRLFDPDASPRWLTVYEVDTVDVFSSRPYRDRLDAPTPRTISVLPGFRATQRMASRIVAATGEGRGACVTTIRFWGTAAAGRLGDDAAAGAILASLASIPSVVSAAIAVSDSAGTAVKTAEKSLRTGDEVPPDAALVVEETDPPSPKESWAERLAALFALADRTAIGCYRHEFGLAAPDG